MAKQMPIWIVYDFGGEWEDKWDSAVCAFDTYEAAKACADKRCVRQAATGDDDDYGWDFIGCRVEQVPLVTDKADRRIEPAIRRTYYVSPNADGTLYRSEYADIATYG